MLNLKLRTKLRCPKHRSVRPENGRGAVKAGCPSCQDLCTIYELSQQAAQRAARHEPDMFYVNRNLKLIEDRIFD